MKRIEVTFFIEKSYNIKKYAISLLNKLLSVHLIITS